MKHWLHAFRLRTLPLAMSSSLLGSALFMLCACTANPADVEQDHSDTVVKEHSALPDSSSSISLSAQDDVELNVTDAKGRKQGHWITMLNGKPWKDEHYEDGLRDGLCKEYFANGDVYQTTYVSGVREGLCIQYQPDSATAVFQSLYINDTSVYLVFPWDLAYFIVPVKGWRVDKDSVEVDVKYLSGQPLYHGYFNRSSGNTRTAPYGEHRAYYEDGILKAAIDYDIDSMVVFNRMGQEVERLTPWQWRGRQLR